MRLNMLRDRVMRTTDIGAALLDAIYEDYYSFSPSIAEELTADPELRDQVFRIGVRPLLAWYGLIEVLALDGDTDGAAERAAEKVLDACPVNSPQTVWQTAALLGRIRRGEPVAEDVPAVRLPRVPLSRLGEATVLSLGDLRAPRDGVGMRRDRSRSGRACQVMDVEAPLDQLPTPSPGDRLEAELARLANGPFAAPPMRRRVGERLASVWPQLQEDLRRHCVCSRARQAESV